MKKFVICFFSLFVCIQITFSQGDKRYENADEIFAFGIVEKIQSQVLSEVRTLNIYLPEGYDPDSLETYPTIYVLDGSANEDFPHIAGLVQFGNMYNLVPKSIVVGIANIDRQRDFTYPSKDTLDLQYLPTHGGSEKFMRFIEKELKPYIDKNFKTNGEETIIGQSLGGLFATEVLIKEPELFDTYIIVSPSLWWDLQFMVKKADDHFIKHPELNKNIFLCVGQEHEEMIQVAEMLRDAILNSNNENIDFYYEFMEEEDHATILHPAVLKAFKALYPRPEEK